MTICLINQDACGREAGNPVCPKCGIDDRVVYPGQGDLEVALEAARAKYCEVHARQLEEAAKAKTEQTPPEKPTANGGNTANQAPPQDEPTPPPPTPPETPQTPPQSGVGKAVIAIAIAALAAGGWWWKAEQDERVRRADSAAHQYQIDQADKVAQQQAELQAQLQAQVQAAEKARQQEAERADQMGREKLAAEQAREDARKGAEASDAARRVAEAQAARAVAAAAAPPTRPPVAVALQPSEAATAPRQAWEPQMVAIPSGSFTMGSNDGDPSEKPPHRVNVRRFELGKYEVTQGQWKAAMGSNPSMFSNCGDNCPVEQVSWDDIQQFIQKLNQKTGKSYRLPSESEWEYAARAGCQSAFNVAGQCKEKIESSEANFYGEDSYNGSSKGVYRQKTLQVGNFQPNSFGLYDMHGNVWEWVHDVWHDNYKGASTDGSAWESGDDTLRVLRGGSWYNKPQFLRSDIRLREAPDYRDFGNGFRLARTVP